MSLESILTSEDVVNKINENIDFLIKIIPEIKPMIGFEHNHPHHHLDVWNHTLLSLALSKNEFEIRLVLLLHDIGKPFSYQEDRNGVRHFKNHDKVSSEMSKNILNRLGYDKSFVDEVSYLIKMHDTSLHEIDVIESYDYALKLYDIQYCDAYAHNPSKLKKRVEYLDKIKNYLDMYKPVINKSIK